MERMPSLGLILDTFERERDRQLNHFDAIATKAGVALGFAGVIAALSAASPSDIRAASLIASLVAASFAVAAFWPRHLPALQPPVLREYMMAEERITRLVLVDTYLTMLDEARALLGSKSRRLKLVMVFLGFAAIAAAVAEIAR
jgi:hypothetical protein